jgi:glutamyl-tRNA reductase
MNLLLIGVNHRTATLEDREALAFGPDEGLDLLTWLMGNGALNEVALLSTCNRTEFYAVAVDAAAAERQLRDAVQRARQRDLLGPGSHRYLLVGEEAAAHLFRVACGLDSMVLGDAQILGQVKGAYQLARRARSAGWLLDRLFETALRSGKRSRTETTIGTGAVSIPSAAVELAASVCGGLEGRRVLVVGAGETARLAAQHARQHRPASIVVVNRSESRAAALAFDVDGSVRPFEALPEALADADVVFSATRAPGAIISAETVCGAIALRPARSLFLVDLAVPRDIDPSVSQIRGVMLNTTESIRNRVDEHRASREAQVPLVERIVNEEAERFAFWARSRAITPTVVALRDHFERIRLEELDRLLAHATDAERSRADKLTRALVNRLLHVPTLRLKDADPASDDGLHRLRAAEELFALSGPAPERLRRQDA